MDRLLDCHVAYGHNINSEIPSSAPGFDSVRKELAEWGIEGGICWRLEQMQTGSLEGNPQLVADLADGPAGWYGALNILPTDTGEMPGPDTMAQYMRQHNIRALWLMPTVDWWVPADFVMEDWLDWAQARRIPLYMSPETGMDFTAIARFLTRFPNLVVVAHQLRTWPLDRFYRPFLRKFRHFYLDVSFVHTDGFYEDFTAWGGGERLLFGSGFPNIAPGANALMLHRASIDEGIRRMIGYGNLERLLSEVIL